MNTKIVDLMISPVMTTTRSKTYFHVRKIMRENGCSCLPVVDHEGGAIGVVTTTDLLEEHKDATPVSHFMTEKVYTVPQYNDVSIAARMMRKHKIHHIIVTDHGRVTGIISSFDLLELIEDRRFSMKNAPEVSKKGGGRRRKSLSTDESL